MKRYKLLKDLPTFQAGETFYINDNGSLCAEEDRSRYSIGNYFKTEEEARLAIAKFKAYQTIKDDAKGFVPDWSDEDQEKWCVRYNYYREWSDIVLVNSLKHLGQVYFATKKDAEQSLKKHKAEWELLLGLKED